MAYKKRRIKKSPSKNVQKIMRRQDQENQAKNAGSLASKYSTVNALDIQMEFVSPEGFSLDSEFRQFGPNDSLNFLAPCQGRCGNGEMDIEEKVTAMMNAGQELGEIKEICEELIQAGSSTTCRTELRCKVKINYF